MPGRRPGRQELRPHRVHDRLKEILKRYFSQRLLNVAQPDDVERDVNTCLPGHCIYIRVNGLLVEGIYDGCLGYAAIRADVLCDLVDLRLGMTREEDLCPLAGEGAGDRTADRATRAIHDGGFVFQ